MRDSSSGFTDGFKKTPGVPGLRPEFLATMSAIFQSGSSSSFVYEAW